MFSLIDCTPGLPEIVQLIVGLVAQAEPRKTRDIGVVHGVVLQLDFVARGLSVGKDVKSAVLI